MKRTKLWRSMLAMTLVVCMLVSYLPQVNAAQTSDVSFEPADDSAVTVSLLESAAETPTAEETVSYAADDMVRVVIRLDGNAAVEQGFSTAGIGENRAAQSYRQMVMRQQAYTTRQIEAVTGEILDVQWNLTILTNAISANVEYGQIPQIKQIDGVADVQIELQFAPPEVATEETLQPSMALSGGMTNVNQSWANGYTGAGTRIAIVDTGLDTDHQSVSGVGLRYAFNLNARSEGIFVGDYIESLNLLDAAEIAEKMSQLNATRSGATNSNKLYLNEKIPFGFNYIDRSYDITHDNDSAGNHGSHVAGIAAANRFIFPGSTTNPVNALESVYVTGNAPDAQLLVMKVFGAAGGAYESDIYASIEDAIVLDADTVNLSLGSVIPGGSNVGLFQDVMENLKNSATTVVVSAGNNFDWANSAQNNAYLGSGHLFTEDVSMNTIGTPASGTNAMAVASVQNKGVVASGSLQLNGKMIEYNDNNSAPASMKDFASLDTSAKGTGTTYEYVMVESYGAEGDFDNIDVAGKIVLVSRGMTINFADKANRAVAAGAAATIIYNNVAGTINMNLEGYNYSNPCVFITQEEAAKFKTAGMAQTAADGSTYYTGEVTIQAGLTVAESDNDYYTMSDFSSWGTTGDLALKPEITAPGGNIYSINGGGTATDRYVGMSGTSMAAPQVSGIGALVGEFIEDHAYTGEFANPERGLTQSLMMSTAVPLVDSEGQYYPLIRQGAGLIDAAAATSADSYIKMSSDASASYDDGKVKAELGDDPDRTGVYQFGFEIHNLDGAEHTYDLSADVFAQDHFEAQTNADGTYTAEYMSESTTPLDAVTVFTVDGKTVESVSVPANGKVVVRTTITLTEAAKQDYLDTYFEKGTYVQAYIFADAQADAEGADGTTHSIPMLAFYGNWTDPSMFWGGSTYEGKLVSNYSNNRTSDYSRDPYFHFEYQWESGGPWYVYQPDNYFEISTANGITYQLGGNPLVADDTYMPERNAISTGMRLEYSVFNLIRNAFQRTITISNLDTGAQYYNHSQDYDYIGAFLNQYSSSYGMNEFYYWDSVLLNDLVEDETIEFAATYLPEYYNEGKLGYGQKPGDGATASVTAVVDNSLPLVQDIQLAAAEQKLQVTAADNQYVAAVVLYNATGDQILSYEGAKQVIDPGETAEYELDFSGITERQFLLQVFDYAMNMATYRITVEDTELVLSGAMMLYDLANNRWNYILDEESTSMQTLTDSTLVCNGATAIGDRVFVATDNNELYVLTAPEFKDAIYVNTLNQNVLDLAYNAADEYIYGVSADNELVRIDPVNGEATVIGALPFQTNTLACDSEGTFYSNRYGSGEVYAYTLETVTTAASQACDFNTDGAVNLADSQLLLDYVTGKESEIDNLDAADRDDDGDIDTYDVYLLQQALPHVPSLLAVAYSTPSRYLQAMEIDPNNGMLYWASYFTNAMQSTEVGFAYLWSIDPQTGEIQRHNDFNEQFTGFVILDADVSSRIPVASGVTQLNIGMKDKRLTVGASATIPAGVSPWNVENPDIIWTSSDESIATVDQDGNVMAVSVGTCQIIAVSAMDESVSASCSITVTDTMEPVQGLKPVSEQASMAVVNNSGKTEPDASATLTLDIPAVMELTNGMQTISLDLSGLTLLSISGADLLSFRQTENLLTVGYVHDEPVSAGQCALSMTFQTESCGDERAIVLRELQRNNEHMSVQTIQELASHIWGNWIVDVTPGCENEGTEQRTCSVCGETEERPVTAIGHAWSEWTVTAEPDCENEGTEQRTCESCEKTEERTVEVTGHTWGDWAETEAATCLEYGLETRSCEACGKSEERNIPAAGSHTWSEWQITTQPTETENGEQTRTCSACGETQTEALPATGHVCYAEAFTDVNVNSWYHSAIDYAVANKLMNGTSATTFAPDANTTRGQLVTILYRAAGSPSVDGMQNPFTDVPAGTYYTNAVIWAANNGLVNGTSATTFAPEMEITREQLVTILHRYAGKPAADMTVLDGYADAGNVSGFARAAMAWAVDNGVVNGTSATKLSPLATATRAQIAAILMRYLSA